MSAPSHGTSPRTAAPPETLAAAPAGKWSDAATAVALAAISILYLWQFRNMLFLYADEGIALQGAARILRGQIPYRDFFSYFTPGSYFWNAGLMKVFGDSLLVPRTVVLLYGVLFSVLTFVLARRMASRTGAVVASLLLLICCLPVGFVVMHNWDSTAAALLALYCALGFLRSPSQGQAAGIGFFTSLTLLFNQARGAGLLLGLVLGFLALRPRLPKNWLPPRHLLVMGALLLLPLLVTAGFFAAQGALGAMVQGLLWAPRHYTEANRVPYSYTMIPISGWVKLFDSGPLWERAFHFFVISPIFILCALPIYVVLIALWCAWKRRPDLDPAQVSAVILSGAVVLGTLLSVVATRADYHHVTFIAPLFFFPLPWVVERWAAPFSGLRKVAPLVAVYLLFTFTLYGLMLLWPLRGATMQVQTRRGLLRVQRKNETIEFIQAHFPAGSSLLIHPYFPLYSFLTRTFSPLPYDYLYSGMHTQEQFEEGVARLETLRPDAVLYEPDFVRMIPAVSPRLPAAKVVQDPVADYILRNYRLCAILDRDSPATFLFMVRKDLPCSDYR
jgi:hypothetical protein